MSSPYWTGSFARTQIQQSAKTKEKIEANRREARVTKLKSVLEDLAISAQNRETLVDMAHTKNPTLLNFKKNREYIVEARKKNEAFYALQKEILNTVDQASPIQLWKWEMAVEDMRKDTLHQADHYAEKNVYHHRRINPKTFKKDWNWTDATGKGPGLEEEMDPLDSSKPNLEESAGEYSDLFKELALAQQFKRE